MADDLTTPLLRSSSTLQDVLSSGDAQALRRRPAQGEWSAWDVAYHVAQLEVWYIAKLCEAAGADAPAAMAHFVAVWQAMRDQAIILAASIPEQRLDQPGLLGGVPDWTPRHVLERMTAHDEEHTTQAREAMSGFATDP